MARKASSWSRAGRPRACTPRRASSRRTGAARRSARSRGARAPRSVTTARSITWSRSCASGSRGLTLAGVGHRVVHGGLEYAAAGARRRGACSRRSRNTFRSRRCTSRTTWRRSGRCSSARRELPQVACFDTAFHRGQPPVAQAFALPQGDHRSRRASATAFTGCRTNTSRRCCRSTTRARRRARSSCCISATARACARSRSGRSVASTMGFTAADGLPMGTRCGNLDPGVILYLMDELKMDARAIEKLIYQQSGLLGVSGISSDMRTLEASDGAGGEGGDRPLRLPDRPRAGLARRRARRARRDRVHGGHRREQPRRCASASAATPRGSASSSTPRPTQRNARAHQHRRRAACRRGSSRPTRS